MDCRPGGGVQPFGLDRQLIIDGRPPPGTDRRGDERWEPCVADSYEDECRRSLAREQAESLAGTDNWAHVDRERVHQDWDVLYREITAVLDGGALPGDPRVQELVRRHFDIVSRFYTPSREAYVGMSLFYAEDGAMKAFHDSYHPRMVEFMGAAIRVFAEAPA